MTKYKPAKTKKYYGAPNDSLSISRTPRKSGGIDVDSRLNTRMLDKFNKNKNIRVIGVCQGHKHPTEEGGRPNAHVAFVTNKEHKIPKTRGVTVRKTEKRVVIERTNKGLAPKSWWDKVTKIVAKY